MGAIMDNIAIHMRISGVAVTDDDVNSRRSATMSLAATWGKEKNVSTIVSRVAEVAEALGGGVIPPSSLGSEVQGAIQKKSSSFLYEERPLEIGVCAGMAMASILTGAPGHNGWTIVDVYAAALWSALSFQQVLEAERRESLRQEVLNAAAKWVTTSAESARSRTEVPDPPIVKITIGETREATNNFKDAIAGTVDALRRNAALDREELDFLWWVQLGRSRLLNRQLSGIDEPKRIIATGIEAATMLRRLPCQVHRELVLRTIDEDQQLDLTEILAAIGDDRTVLGATVEERYVTANPTVFPLLYALVTGEINGAGAVLKRCVSEWGARALLEVAFARMMQKGAGRL